MNIWLKKRSVHFKQESSQFHDDFVIVKRQIAKPTEIGHTFRKLSGITKVGFKQLSSFQKESGDSIL